MKIELEHLDAPAFLTLWEAWGFSVAGAPEDASSYLYEVLIAIDRPCDADGYVRAIGGLDGQQEFVFNCLRAMGLLLSGEPPRNSALSPLGKACLDALERGTHLDAFISDKI